MLGRAGLGNIITSLLRALLSAILVNILELLANQYEDENEI